MLPPSHAHIPRQSAALLEIDNLIKSYDTAGGTLTVLKGISLYVARGEFVSIMGPSGSGKSTLAAILGCLSSPTSGAYVLDGTPVSNYSPNRLARFRNEKIGYIFQEFNLLDGMTTVDNVALPLVYAGVGARERRQRAVEALCKVNLGDRLDHMPKQLSGGQKQRVAIARALVTNPVLLFADEPTGALDAKNTIEVMDLLQKLNIGGHTIVQVTHSSEDALFSKRIINLVDGQIVKDTFVQKFAIASAAPADENGKAGLYGRLWQIAQIMKPTEAEDMTAMMQLSRRTTEARSQVEAAKALAPYGDNRFNSFLLKLFRSSHWAVRAEVVRACDVASHDLALGFFIAGLRDENPWVRFLCLTQLRRVAPDLHVVGGEETVFACLDDKDERVRGATVTLVGTWKKAAFIDRLIAIVRDERDTRVRSNALEALEQHRGLEHDQKIEATLEHACADKHHRVAVTAAKILSQRSPTIVMSTLKRFRASSSAVERSAAAWGYGNIGEVETCGAILLDMLRNESEELVVSATQRSLAKLAREGYPFHRQVAAVIETRVEELPANAEAK